LVGYGEGVAGSGLESIGMNCATAFGLLVWFWKRRQALWTAGMGAKGLGAPTRVQEATAAYREQEDVSDDSQQAEWRADRWLFRITVWDARRHRLTSVTGS
jgi:hypothetical protein